MVTGYATCVGIRHTERTVLCQKPVLAVMYLAGTVRAGMTQMVTEYAICAEMWSLL